MRSQRLLQSIDVRPTPRIDKIHIERRSSRSVNDTRHSADENELHLGLHQGWQQLLELRLHESLALACLARAISPARCSSEANRIKRTNFSKRSAGVSFRFSRKSDRSISPSSESISASKFLSAMALANYHARLTRESHSRRLSLLTKRKPPPQSRRPWWRYKLTRARR